MERTSVVGGGAAGGISYYDLDRLYTESVERYASFILTLSLRNFRGESNTIGSVISQATYTLCWNAFTK